MSLRRDSNGKNLQLFNGVKTSDNYITFASKMIEVEPGLDFYTTGSRVAGNPTGSITTVSQGREGAKAFMLSSDFVSGDGSGQLHSYYNSNAAVSASNFIVGIVYPIALSRVNMLGNVTGSVILLY